jgi:hypothetical protein
MPDHCEWQRQFEKESADNEHHHSRKGEGQILMDDRRRPTGQAVCRRKLFQIL